MFTLFTTATLNWTMDGIRMLFATLDLIIYSVIAKLYDLIIGLADIQIFSTGAINDFTSRIYTVLGVFMLFKLSFSIIKYVINPELMSDKQQGTSKLITNVLVTIVLISITPFLFAKMRELQHNLLEENILGNFILGTDPENGMIGDLTFSEECGNKITASGGNFIALASFRTFYQPGSDADASMLEANGYCKSKNNSVGDYLKYLIYNDRTALISLTYVIDYNFFISTAVGIIIALILISICLDVAVRSVKLGFLEIIAPIPIISYVDPNSSKNGLFNKWLKMVGTTWASLFVRLAAVYLAVYVLSMLDDIDLSGFDPSVGLLAKLFMLIGVLIFAKQFPKILEELFPAFKNAGKIQLNPFKKIGEEALGGKALVGGSLGLAGGALAGYKAGVNAGAPLRGALVGGMQGAKSGTSAKNGAFMAGANGAYKSLTGNEMSRISLDKLLLNNKSGDAQSALNEVKVPLKNANEKLRNAQTRLNMASHNSALMSEKLHGLNINTSDVGNERNKFASKLNEVMPRLDASKSAYEASSEKINSMKAEYENAKKLASNNLLEGTGNRDYESAKATVRNFENPNSEYNNSLGSHKSLEENYNNLQNAASSCQSVINTIDSYTNSIRTESECRAEIGGLEKDINTLKSEKSQREQFYNVDKSPVGDVNATMQKHRS